MIPANYTEIDTLYRQIVAKKARCFAVSSAAAGEGATTLCYSLARRASRAGRTVLMIDLNVFKPSLGQLLGVDPVAWSPHDGSYNDAIVSFGADGMSVLPAPETVSLSGGFREVEAMKGMLDDLRTRYDLILLDIAPILVTNARNVPPLTACRATGAVLLSVMMRKTKQVDLERAAAVLEDERITVLGIAVNDRDNPSLGNELEREARRLETFSKGLSGFFQNQLRKVPFLYERP